MDRVAAAVGTAAGAALGKVAAVGSSVVDTLVAGIEVVDILAGDTAGFDTWSAAARTHG